jgi:hypothetical protein
MNSGQARVVLVGILSVDLGPPSARRTTCRFLKHVQVCPENLPFATVGVTVSGVSQYLRSDCRTKSLPAWVAPRLNVKRELRRRVLQRLRRKLRYDIQEAARLL